MVPSQEDIASFIAFAPDADEGKAFLFLEVLYPRFIRFNLLMFTAECDDCGRSCITVLRESKLQPCQEYISWYQGHQGT